MYILLLI